MGHCKNYAKGNVYKLEVSNTGLLQETRKKSQINNLTLHLKQLEKEKNG